MPARPLRVAVATVMHDENDERPAPKGLTVPPDLTRLSVFELEALKERLQAELGRVSTEIERRDGVRAAADALFRKPGG